MPLVSLEEFCSIEFRQQLANDLQGSILSQDEVNELGENIIRIICCDIMSYIGPQGQCLYFALNYLHQKPLSNAACLTFFMQQMLKYNFIEYIAQSLLSIHDTQRLSGCSNQVRETFMILNKILIFYADEFVLFRLEAVRNSSLLDVLLKIISDRQNQHEYDSYVQVQHCFNITIESLYNLTRLDECKDILDRFEIPSVLSPIIPNLNDVNTQVNKVTKFLIYTIVNGKRTCFVVKQIKI